MLQRLRADPRTRDIPVVIASADASPGRVDNSARKAHSPTSPSHSTRRSSSSSPPPSPNATGPTRRRLHGGPWNRTYHRRADISRRRPETATPGGGHGLGRRPRGTNGGRLVHTQPRTAPGRARRRGRPRRDRPLAHRPTRDRLQPAERALPHRRAPPPRRTPHPTRSCRIRAVADRISRRHPDHHGSTSVALRNCRRAQPLPEHVNAWIARLRRLSRDPASLDEPTPTIAATRAASKEAFRAALPPAALHDLDERINALFAR